MFLVVSVGVHVLPTPAIVEVAARVVGAPVAVNLVVENGRAQGMEAGVQEAGP